MSGLRTAGGAPLDPGQVALYVALRRRGLDVLAEMAMFYFDCGSGEADVFDALRELEASRAAIVKPEWLFTTEAPKQ